MSRGAKISSLSVVAAAVLGIIYTIVAGNQPLLGLDLQGGVSVVLEPTSTSGEDVTDESLDLTVELLRGRIDEIGVAEPEISRQGNNIVVALPGVVEDQEQALARLQQTAELRFRPVIFDLGPDLTGLDLTDSDGNVIDLDDLNVEGLDDVDEGSDDGSDATTDADATTDDDATTDEGDVEGDEEESMVGQAGRFSPLVVAQDETTTTEAPDTDETSTTDAPTAPRPRLVTTTPHPPTISPSSRRLPHNPPSPPISWPRPKPVRSRVSHRTTPTRPPTTSFSVTEPGIVCASARRC